MRLLVDRLCSFLSMLSGATLMVMMGLTLADVVLRYLGRPITGVYEVVAFLGVVVTGLALPRASLSKAHVYVDLMIDKMPERKQKAFKILTRVLGFGLFFSVTWGLILMGMNYYTIKTVTLSLRVPLYPVVFALAASCAAQCLVSVCEIIDDKGAVNE